MAGRTKVILINEKDNVATAVEALNAGSKVSVEVQGRVDEVKLLSDIPMGHKLALRDIDEGNKVVKIPKKRGDSTDEGD